MKQMKRSSCRIWTLFGTEGELGYSKENKAKESNYKKMINKPKTSSFLCHTNHSFFQKTTMGTPNQLR